MGVPYKGVRIVVLLVLMFPTPAHSQTFQVLHSFGSSGDGYGPFGPLTLDSRGNLYGVTATGGSGQCSDYGCGTVFELIPQANGTWTELLLHSFTAGNDGAIPWGGLVFDQIGNLYGTLPGDNGGAIGGVFQLSPALPAG